MSKRNLAPVAAVTGIVLALGGCATQAEKAEDAKTTDVYEQSIQAAAQADGFDKISGDFFRKKLLVTDDLRFLGTLTIGPCEFNDVTAAAISVNQSNPLDLSPVPPFKPVMQITDISSYTWQDASSKGEDGAPIGGVTVHFENATELLKTATQYNCR